MEEQKVMEVMEKDIDPFSKLVHTITMVQATNIVQATNAVIELINVIIEDIFNKKEEETEREIN